MTAPLVLTDTLGGSSLSKAARAGQLPQWFVPVPRTADEWRTHAEAVRSSVSARWLDDLAPAIQAGGRAAARLSASAGGRGLVVTTGQQPGLFGGPLMTFAKALSARALADTLQDLLDIPVAPVFWAATDDADFDEAARVSLALEGGARELALEQLSPAGTPMTGVPMGVDIHHLIPLLRDACGSVVHASYLEAALAEYRESATVGDAYVALLRRVLEPLEIAVLDVSHPAVTAAAAPTMLRAAKRATAVAAAVKQRGEEITAAGYRPQVEEVPGLSIVFVNEHGTKRRLTQAEAEQFAAGRDQWLSSTVLLRPVLERALLPTATYVGGPGEIAYFAQVSAVADALELPRPLVVPRWSTTIVEPRIRTALDQLGVTMGELVDPHAVEGRLARERLSQAMASALRELRSGMDTAIDKLGAANDGVVAGEVISGVSREMAHRLERLERRVVAGAKRREDDLMRRIATVRGALYPHGAKQERKLGWLPFLVREGMPLVEQMLAAATQHAQTLVTGAPSLPPAKAPAAVR